jgi:vacuolar-type H+-ATPase subunit H
MLIKFLKKKLLKSIVNDIVKELPEIKEQAVTLAKEHSDEIIEKVKEAIVKAVKDFIASKVNK